MKKYPQISINVPVKQEGKVKFYTNKAVKEAIDKAKEELSDIGRIVVRPSGTEPKLRVMVECEDKKIMKKVAEEVADVVKKELGSN